MKLTIFSFFAVLFLSITTFSQTSSLTSGTITVANPTLTPCPSGAVRSFNYLGVNTNISGLISPNFSGATMSECYGDSCCKYGIGFKVRDSFSGNNNFRSETTPSVLINGTTYTGILFRGSLNVNGTIKVPFYYRKKQTATLTGKVTLTGHLNVYASLTDLNLNNPFFTKPISDQNVQATITIQPRQSDPTRFDVTNLKYEFVNAN